MKSCSQRSWHDTSERCQRQCYTCLGAYIAPRAKARTRDEQHAASGAGMILNCQRQCYACLVQEHAQIRARMMQSCNQRSWHDTLKGVKGNATHAFVHILHRAQICACMMTTCSQRSWHDTLNCQRQCYACLGAYTGARANMRTHDEIMQPAELA